MQLKKRILVKVDEKFHRQIRVKSAMLGVPVSEVVRKSLKKFCEQPIKKSNNKIAV